MKVKLGKPHIEGDKVIWIVYLILSVLSLIFVFSSIGKSVYRTNGDIVFMFIKQTFIISFGIVVVYIVHKIRYVNYAKGLKLIYAFSIFILIFTLVVGEFIGKAANRWLEIPGLGQFQPSEIVKYILVVYVASELETLRDKIRQKDEFWKLMFKIFLVCVLIFPENFSTSIIIFLACFALVFIAGARMKHILMVVVLGFVMVSAVLGMYYVGFEFGRSETWVNRIDNFINNDPNEDNQYNSAIMAIATGGVTGVGIGNTVQGRFLSESHNDFIFAVILEEGGTFMCVVILLAYFVLFYRCIKVSRESKGLFGSYLSSGISFVIIIQALVNILVATGLMPVTGQTLPFISYGGTSFLISSFALGIILNISAETEKAKKQIENKTDEENSQVDNIKTQEV
ncbi:MAG: FtsW/RodA/SpoVE family cell cycle protein [Bacteroidales bacterium]|jgi:cell division protein FtsW|nr:FtsW/RodA/SpoVE family cell cycle protein [Bacteroidales bacterium]